MAFIRRWASPVAAWFLFAGCAIPAGSDEPGCPDEGCADGRATGKGDVAVPDRDRLWPRGDIYIRSVDASQVTAQDRAAAEEKLRALAWQLWFETPVRLRIGESSPDGFDLVLKLRPTGSGGRSPPGRYRVDPRFESAPDVLTHELGHVIGFRHTHVRADRDDHLVVHRPWITGGDAGRNFFQFPGKLVGPYDFGSVMQYDSFQMSERNANGDLCATTTPRSFGADPADCVTPRMLGHQRIIPPSDFSRWNLIAISVLYCDRRFCGTYCAPRDRCTSPAVREKLDAFARWEASPEAQRLYARFRGSAP